MANTILKSTSRNHNLLDCNISYNLVDQESVPFAYVIHDALLRMVYFSFEISCSCND